MISTCDSQTRVCGWILLYKLSFFPHTGKEKKKKKKKNSPFQVPPVLVNTRGMELISSQVHGSGLKTIVFNRKETSKLQSILAFATKLLVEFPPKFLIKTREKHSSSL